MIDFDKIAEWFEQIGATHYRVKSAQNKKLLGRTLGEPKLVFDHFKEAIKLLDAGTYTIESSDNPQNARGQSYFAFEIGGDQNQEEMSSTDMAEMFSKAKAEAKAEMQLEAVIKKVDILEAEAREFKEFRRKAEGFMRELEANDEGTSMLDKATELAEIYDLAKDKGLDLKL